MKAPVQDDFVEGRVQQVEQLHELHGADASPSARAEGWRLAVASLSALKEAKKRSK